MSKAEFQKNVGLVTIMTRRGESVETIMAKTHLNESTVRHWMDKTKKNMH